MATYEHLSYGGDDGAIVNASSVPLGFYGKTPVVQYPDVGAASTYLTTTNTTAVFGFNSAAAATGLIGQVSSIVQALRGVGLIT